MSRRASFDSDITDKQQKTYQKAAHGKNKSRLIYGLWSIRLSSYSKNSNNAFSAENFLRRIRENMAKALSFVSIKRSSRKVSSSTLPRSRSYVEPLDSHRAAAIEDCIEFLNSSSCLRKSKSVS